MKSTYKDKYPVFWNFIEAYDQSFPYSYESEENYWRRYNDKEIPLILDKSEGYTKISKEEFIKKFSLETSSILELNDEDFNRFKEEVKKDTEYLIWNMETKEEYASWFSKILDFLNISK